MLTTSQWLDDSAPGEASLICKIVTKILPFRITVKITQAIPLLSDALVYSGGHGTVTAPRILQEGSRLLWKLKVSQFFLYVFVTAAVLVQAEILLL